MHESLRNEVDLSKKQQRTTLTLRQCVLGMVDEALRNHYGDNYSDRCFRSSMATREILTALGIDCKLWSGHVCMMRVSIVDEAPEFGWAGFWDQDNHVWAFNDFGELIDLTIAHLHQHAASTSRADLPIPAIWWNDVAQWPSTMIYIPAGNPTAEFTSTEQHDADQFMAEVREMIATNITKGIGQGYQEAILSGPESLNTLVEQMHPWVLLCSHAQEIPMPDWIQKRINEVSLQWNKSGETGSSTTQESR